MNMKIGEMMSIKLVGGQASDVRYTGEALDSPSDLDWGKWKLRYRYRGGG